MKRIIIMITDSILTTGTSMTPVIMHMSMSMIMTEAGLITGIIPIHICT